MNKATKLLLVGCLVALPFYAGADVFYGGGNLPTQVSELSPATLSLNDLGLDAERTSSSFVATGFNHITLYVDHTNNTSTRVDVALDASPDAGTTWFPVQTTSTSSGSVTLSDLNYEKTVAGDDTWVIELNISPHELMRIRMDDGSDAGDSDDKATITASLSRL